jgi:putative pyrroloquinoline-quinone binding quinoprotein
MIGAMRLREHGASRPVAAAVSLRPGARITAGVLLVALAGCTPSERASGPVKRFEAGENLGAMTVAGGDVWVNDFGREEVVRIEGRSGRVLARLPLGRRTALATAGRSVWALRWGGRFFRAPTGPLVRIDPRSGRVIQRLAARGPSGAEMIGFGVLASGHSLWVWGPTRVLQIEASSGRALRDLPVDQRYGELTGAAPDGSGGLLATTGDGHLARTAPAGVLPGRRQPALTGSELQVLDGGRAIASRGGGVIAVSTDGARLLWRSQLGFRVSTVIPHDGVLLVQGAAFRDDGDRLWALDPATGRVLASTRIPSFSTTSMTVAGGSLWVTTAAGEVIVFPQLAVDLFVARARSRP